MRVDLPDGQWAELRERPTVNQLNLVRRAMLRISADPGAGADVALAYVEAYVSAWSIRNPQGQAVTLEQAGDAPDELVQAIALEAAKLYRERPDPKGLIASSPPSPPA